MRCTIPIGGTAAAVGVTVRALTVDLLESKITIDVTPGETLDEPSERLFAEFEAFIREYPETLPEFRDEVLRRLQRQRRVSARSAMLAIRRQHRLSKGRYRVPLKNQFSGFLARLLLTERPQLAPRLGTDVPVDPRFESLLEEICR